MIVQALGELQKRHGWLPPDELRRLSRERGIPLHRLHEVASFFPHYRLQPAQHQVEVRVCRDMACHLRGAPDLLCRLREMAAELGPTSADVQGVSCLGQCDVAPAVAIDGQVLRNRSAEELADCIRKATAGAALPHDDPDRSPLPGTIDPYEGQPAFKALEKFIETRDAAGLLATLAEANLVGMGGAGFPTHSKWTAVRDAPGETKYIVCNADESEPGTFKDRELLRRAPWLVIEGMILAGLVTGARQGYLYIRHEYEPEIEVLREAIAAAYESKRLGERLLGSDLTFDLELFVSPGGYICGEESALLEAMEDRRAEPRNKPPFPVHEGLHAKPTVINNVETLSWVPAILLRGGAWYAGQGRNGGKGLRYVSISGDVARPGVYEVPFGLTVRELVMERAGGMRDGQRLQAIAPSGPSGGFLPSRIPANMLPPALQEKLSPDAEDFDILDLPLEPGSVRSLGALLGAAFVVVGDRASMVDLAANCVRFYRNESCGKCVPCRLGSQKLVELTDAMLERRYPRQKLELIDELAMTMELASICGLGMVAAKPITSVIRYFRRELEAHLT